MNRYRVEIARGAVRSLAGLPRNEQQRIRVAMDLLAAQPRPPGCVALAGEKSVYRVRVGTYRILYEVVDARLIVHVIRIGRRRDVHRRR